MAAPTPKPNKRKRRSAAPPAAPAPSRIHNRRQQEVLETVAGYESVQTYGVILWSIHIIWIVVGVVVVGLGAGVGALAGSETADSLYRLYQSISYGMALLTAVTVLASMVWAGQASFNVTKLGRTPSIGQVKIVGRHIPGLIIGVGAFVAASRFDDYERPLRLLGGAAFVWGVLVFVGLAVGILNMLWRSSSLGDSAKVAPNRDISLWFAGMLLFAYGSTGVETLEDISLAATGFLILMVGLGVLLSSAMVLRFVPLVAQRQEKRVVAILESFHDDETGTQPVTAQQIEDAWSASSDLFSVDY